jgi:hypothetical protein
MQPYVSRTRDFGQSWESLVTEEIEGYCRVLREDHVNADLLLLGTEFGLFVSLDGGATWTRFTGGVPHVAVHDIAVHPRTHDVVLGTHGRGILIIDDISPLRQLTADVLAADATPLASRPTIMQIPASVQQFEADANFVGQNPPDGALITYYLRRRHVFGDFKLEVLNPDGSVLTEVPATRRRGVNRVTWDLRGRPPQAPRTPGLNVQPFTAAGPKAASGTYAIRLTQGDATYTGTVTLQDDPRADYTAADRALQDETVLRLYDMMERIAYLVEAAQDLVRQVEQIRPELGEGTDATASTCDDFAAESATLLDELVLPQTRGITVQRRLREKIARLYGAVNGFEGRPTDSQLQFTKTLDAQLSGAEETFARLTDQRLARLNAELTAAGTGELRVLTQSEWTARRDQP